MADIRGFVRPTVAAKIDAIAGRARRLGWPSDRLFDPNLNDFGRPQGLAATLDPGDVIVDVKRKYISVRKNAYHLLKFPRS